MSISKENRRESYGQIKPTLTARQRIVLAILKQYGDLTAQEVADTLCFLRITPTNERNFAAPRLTELCEQGLVKVIGKKICGKTGRTVSVWSAVKKTTPLPLPDEQIQLEMTAWLNSLERGGKQKQRRKQQSLRDINPSAVLHMEISI
ncbi:MAG: hypothetical protein PHV32_03760 [Eubacteriales bacterium]|nr:hypothetical protein [Eubacteriales bacterium]